MPSVLLKLCASGMLLTLTACATTIPIYFRTEELTPEQARYTCAQISLVRFRPSRETYELLKPEEKEHLKKVLSYYRDVLDCDKVLKG